MELKSLEQLRDVVHGPQRTLTRHLLLALYDSRDGACVAGMARLKFPYPFAHWSQEWHGVWWGDIVKAAQHDVAASLEAGRPSSILTTFERTVGAARRSAHGVSMPSCPTLLLQPKGERLGTGLVHKPNALSEAGFADWVFGFLKVELTIRNEHPSVVRVNWIHGGYVKERLTLEPPSPSP